MERTFTKENFSEFDQYDQGVKLLLTSLEEKKDWKVSDEIVLFHLNQILSLRHPQGGGRYTSLRTRLLRLGDRLKL
jgi:hypothetical protein